jgi:LCP family protein required for cell wall assembly
MRTTLKRGIGRGASLGGGNGHRASFPPSARTPMRRYFIPPPPRRTGLQTLRWFFGRVVIAIVIVAVGLAGGGYLYEHQTVAALAPHSKAVKKAQKDLATVPPPSEPAVALLVGYDKRAGADAAAGLGGSRSDTVMLIRADPQTKSISMLSFPRDLVVPVYCNNVPVTNDRINSAWSRCSAQGTLETVQHLTGLPVNYLITVDFHGFKLLVNKLGGVYMDVDHRYLNTQGGPFGYAKIDLQPGYQKLNGQQALDFVRFRHTDSDLYRLARQQLFIEALKDRLATGFSIFTIPKILGALKGNLEIAPGGGGGAVSIDTIKSYASLGYKLPAGHLFRDKLDNLQPYGPGGAEVIATQSTVDTAVQQFMHPDVSLPQRANAAALGVKPRQPRKPTVQPKEISTLVLNGTTQAGLAANTSYKLAVAGYQTRTLLDGTAANAPPTSSTTVYYDASQPQGHAAATALQSLFGKDAIVAPIVPAIAPLAQAAGNPETVVVLGSSWDGNLDIPEAQPVTPIKHEAPSVSFDPALTEGQLRAVRSRVGFPLLVPHAIATGSNLALLSPVRVYKPAPHHKGVRLTFVTGAGNVYYGIEETDWTSPPVLRSPTLQRTFGGRRFDFYTVGGHIHMIALHSGSAVYWVTNTLLDELSNETMIAIAKSLKPLGTR